MCIHKPSMNGILVVAWPSGTNFQLLLRTGKSTIPFKYQSQMTNYIAVRGTFIGKIKLFGIVLPQKSRTDVLLSITFLNSFSFRIYCVFLGFIQKKKKSFRHSQRCHMSIFSADWADLESNEPILFLTIF